MPYIPKKQKQRHWIPQRKPFETWRQTRDATQHDTYRWEKASKRYLAAHPLCVMCEAKGITKASDHTDHIDHERYDFWDEAGWQALCRECHTRKSAKDGSIARRKAAKVSEGEGGVDL